MSGTIVEGDTCYYIVIYNFVKHMFNKRPDRPIRQISSSKNYKTCVHGHPWYCGFCEAAKATKCVHGHPWYCGFCGKVENVNTNNTNDVNYVIEVNTNNIEADVNYVIEVNTNNIEADTNDVNADTNDVNADTNDVNADTNDVNADINNIDDDWSHANVDEPDEWLHVDVEYIIEPVS
jgi:hypothetical protein